MEKNLILTQCDIEKGLYHFGIRRGDIIEVHSSLSSFGWVQGGAAAVVDALMNVVGEEGTLVMSAYPLSKPLPLTESEKACGILAKVQLFELDYTGPTGMGVIADEFHLRPGTILGNGFHRVCAWGREGSILSEGYHRLLEKDGWVLLLGVSISSCSCMHQAENVKLPDEISRFFILPEEIRKIYPEDMYIAFGQTPDDAWEKVRMKAEDLGYIKKQTIGGAACMLFKARQVVGIYENALRTDPLELYGLKKDK
jgi:aminoglycoside N3'-acetyltransferase